MLAWFHAAVAKIRGRNSESTPSSVILAQLNEPRPLPIGRAEWDIWSDRIISGACITQYGASVRSQKFCLANLIMHLGPQEDHKPDIFFIKSLRKNCTMVTVNSIRQELFAEAKAEEQAAPGAFEEVLMDKNTMPREAKTAT
jgi:hypothetical protein